MICFTHHDSPAVAICKACGRAVCPSCAIDMEYAVACSEGCKTEASELHLMNAKAKRIYGLNSGKKLAPIAPLIWALLSSPFVYMIVTSYLRKGTIEWFSLIFVVACIGIGIITWRRAKALELNC